MSRSKKKYPISFLCSVGRGEMKKWKTAQNRSIRRSNQHIPSGGFYKRMSEIWNSPGDGKADKSSWYPDEPWKLYTK